MIELWMILLLAGIVALVILFWWQVVLTNGMVLLIPGYYIAKVIAQVDRLCQFFKRTSKRVYWWYYDRRQEFDWWCADWKRKHRS
jgi:hypothetical protein